MLRDIDAFEPAGRPGKYVSNLDRATKLGVGDVDATTLLSLIPGLSVLKRGKGLLRLAKSKGGKALGKLSAGKLFAALGLAGLGVGVADYGHGVAQDMDWAESDEDKSFNLQKRLYEMKKTDDKKALDAMQEYEDKKLLEARGELKNQMALGLASKAHEQRYNGVSAFMDRYQQAKSQELVSLGQLMQLI